MTKRITLLFYTCLIVACGNSSPLFNRQVWIDNPDVRDISNPRARMVQDVMKNHLKPGMHRNAVLDLLGKPYEERVENRLPKNTIVPESISFSNKENLKPENSKKATDALNEFYRANGIPVSLLRYPVGWSTMDPNFLIITMTDQGLVEDYWVEQS